MFTLGGQVRAQRVSMKCRAACVTHSTLRLKRSLHCRKVQEGCEDDILTSRCTMKYDIYGVFKIKSVQIKCAIYSLLCVHCVCHGANWNGLWKSSCLVFSRMMFLLKAANEKLFEGGNKAVKAEIRLNPSGATYCWVSVFTLISSSTLERTLRYKWPRYQWWTFKSLR